MSLCNVGGRIGFVQLRCRKRVALFCDVFVRLAHLTHVTLTKEWHDEEFVDDFLIEIMQSAQHHSNPNLADNVDRESVIMTTSKISTEMSGCAPYALELVSAMSSRSDRIDACDVCTKFKKNSVCLLSTCFSINEMRVLRFFFFFFFFFCSSCSRRIRSARKRYSKRSSRANRSHRARRSCQTNRRCRRRCRLRPVRPHCRLRCRRRRPTRHRLRQATTQQRHHHHHRCPIRLHEQMHNKPYALRRRLLIHQPTRQYYKLKRLATSVDVCCCVLLI
jgi:hypothetical protein